MNKYLKALFCIPNGFVKTSILKLMPKRKTVIGFPTILSPLTEVTQERDTNLNIGNQLKMHNGSKIRVRKQGNLTIGNNLGMSNGCVITCYEKISIGSNVMFGPNVLIYDQDHDYKTTEGIKALKYKTAPIKIGDNVWIGANSIILRGSTIGNNCVIAAGSIVKGEIPENSLFHNSYKPVISNIYK